MLTVYYRVSQLKYVHSVVYWDLYDSTEDKTIRLEVVLIKIFHYRNTSKELSS